MASLRSECIVCLAAGLDRILVGHVRAAHPSEVSTLLGAIEEQQRKQNSLERAERRKDGPSCKIPKTQKPENVPAKIAATPPSNPGYKKKKKPRMKLYQTAVDAPPSPKKVKSTALKYQRILRGCCIICGQEFSRSHWDAHRSSIPSITREKSSIDQGFGSSIRTVSGGLPSLGKRSR